MLKGRRLVTSGTGGRQPCTLQQAKTKRFDGSARFENLWKRNQQAEPVTADSHTWHSTGSSLQQGSRPTREPHSGAAGATEGSRAQAQRSAAAESRDLEHAGDDARLPFTLLRENLAA